MCVLPLLGVASFDIAHTVTAGTDRFLLVGSQLPGAAESITSVVLDPGGMDLAFTEQTFATTTGYVAYLHYLINPPVGTFDIQLTPSIPKEVGAIVRSFTGVHQTSPWCTKIRSVGSCGLPVIEMQQASKTVATLDRS